MTSGLASWIVFLVFALALLAAVLAGVWLYAYSTTFDPALSGAIEQMSELRPSLR